MSEYMRHILFYALMVAVTVLCLVFGKPAWAVPLQPWEGGTGCENGVTVLELPAAPLIGTICVITDGLTESDITVGGGTKTNIAIYMGDAAGGVDFGWKQLDLDYTEVSDSFYVTSGTAGVLPIPSVIPSCANGTNGGVLGYNTSTHAFVCYDTTRLAAVATTADPTTGLCYWSTTYRTIQCGNSVGVTTLFSTYGAQPPMLRDFELGSTGGVGACLIFEGNADNTVETTLCATNPTSIDKAINLPDASGTVAVSAASPITLSATGEIGLTAFSGDVSSSGSTLTIGADKVLESHLKAVDAAADEECLTYETTTGDFEWQACGGGGIDEATGNTYWLRLDGTNDPVTGDVYFQTGAQLTIGSSTNTMVVNGTTYDSSISTHIDDGVAAGAGIEVHRHENTTAGTGAVVYGARSRGSMATPTVVSEGDTLLSIGAVGYDGTDYALSSRIDFVTGSGTPAGNDMPGSIVFKTSPDGSQTPATRVVIDSTGEVLLEQSAYLAYEGATNDGVYTYLVAADPTVAAVITLPDASGTVAVSATGGLSLSAAGAVSIASDGVTEAKLKAVDAPADEECLTYETTTGDFEWQNCATSVGSGTFLLLDGTNDPVTSNVVFISNSGAGIDAVQDSSGSAATGGLHATNNVDAATVDAATFYGPNRSAAANGDNVNITFELEDSGGNYREVASIRAVANDVTAGGIDSGLILYGEVGSVQLEMARLVTTTAGQANVVINEGSNDIDFRIETNGEVNMFKCDGSLDSCTFGSATEIAFVGIDGTADQIQFAIQGHSTQTSSVLLIENSAGTDALTVNVSGQVTMYNSEATAGLGMPYQVANVALTGQAATIGATTLYSPTVDTTVMVKAYTIVTQAATSSSTLGSVGLVYTDADNATSQTVTMRCNNRTGTSVTSVTGNSLTTSLTCEGMYRVNGGTSMTYNMGYASSGATPMQYSLYITAHAVQQ